MKSRLDRIISIATLLALLVVIGLMLKRSSPVAQPKASAGIPVSSQSADPQSLDRKVDQPEPAERPVQQTQPPQAGSGYSAGYSAAPSTAPHASENLAAPG